MCSCRFSPQYPFLCHFVSVIILLLERIEVLNEILVRLDKFIQFRLENFVKRYLYSWQLSVTLYSSSCYPHSCRSENVVCRVPISLSTSCLLFFTVFNVLCTRHYTASFHSTRLKIVSSWLTLVADHCDPLMSWRVPQREHVRISETGVFPSLDRLSETLYLSLYVTDTSHSNSLRDFWRHFGLHRAAAQSDWCFFAPCINILTYLLTTTIVVCKMVV